jgi:hypothetical protein
MPGFSDDSNPHFCDDCVNRGCECNHNYVCVDSYHPPIDSQNLPGGEEGVDWKWIEKNVSWSYIDDKGREFPCVEYMWDPDGWERELNPHEYEKEI